MAIIIHNSEDFDHEMAALDMKYGKEMEELENRSPINPGLWTFVAYTVGILCMGALMGTLAVGAYTIVNWIVS